MSALFAATYPERAVALVAFGIFAKRIRSPDYPWAPTVEDRQREIEHVEQEWGARWTSTCSRRARLPIPNSNGVCCHTFDAARVQQLRRRS